MAALLKEITAGGEVFMTLGSTLLVKSKSVADHWYRIEDARCSCKGFEFRGVCRHITASLELEAETVADTSVVVELTENYGGGWAVIWDGHQHGGTHSHREDAESHADELRHAPEWDRREWRDLHGDWPATVPAASTRPQLTVLEGGR